MRQKRKSAIDCTFNLSLEDIRVRCYVGDFRDYERKIDDPATTVQTTQPREPEETKLIYATALQYNWVPPTVRASGCQRT
jgi:hypothetical protein